MTEATTELLGKARQSLDAAQLLLQQGYVDFSASRTYYAMFYCAEALLFSRELCFGKHSAVIAAFGKHFVKTGVFDPKFHRYLLDAFDVRNLGDYGTMHVVSKEKAVELLTWAQEFLLEVELLLKTS